MTEQEPNAFDHFVDEGLITDVVRVVKAGKEASVHLCRANASTTGETLAALKVYHPLDRRDFRDESIYRDGEWIKERRVRIALQKHTRFGREIQGALWVHREWETLNLLHEAGAPVPRPIALGPDAILMTFVGDEELAAPQLRSHRPGPDEAAELFRQMLRAIELMLYRDVIHGDLSAVQRPRVAGPGDGDRPAAGGGRQEEPIREGPARPRRPQDLRVLRPTRRTLERRAGRERPVDRLGARGPRAQGAPDGAPALT